MVISVQYNNDLSKPVTQAPLEISKGMWVVIGYCFWLGFYLGAVIMHAATK